GVARVTGISHQVDLVPVELTRVGRGDVDGGGRGRRRGSGGRVQDGEGCGEQKGRGARADGGEGWHARTVEAGSNAAPTSTSRHANVPVVTTRGLDRSPMAHTRRSDPVAVS